MFSYSFSVARTLSDEREREIERALAAHELMSRQDDSVRSSSILAAAARRLVGLRSRPAPEPCDPIAQPAACACA